MKKRPVVSIVVLNFNGLKYLKECLPLIQNQSYKRTEIIVTDNNSTDGSVQYVEKLGSIRLIRNPRNFGYSKANNIAARQARGEFILFLNNDTRIPVNFIETLVNDYRDKTIVAPAQIRSWDRSDDGYSGFGMDIFGYPFAEQDHSKTKLFYADGAALFLKKTDFIRIGMFDPDLFIFQEDIDLSWRAQIMGYDIVPNFKAKYFHYGGATILGKQTKNSRYLSSYFRRYLNEKNILRNLLKNYSLPFLIMFLPSLLMVHLFEIVALCLTGRWRVAECYLKAYKWNAVNLRNTIKWRMKIQKSKRVSDVALIRRMYWRYSKLDAFLRLGFPRFY